jgi:hypothetical protein
LTVEAGLVLIPRVVDSRIEREERSSGKGGMQTHVWVTLEVDYVSTVDGTRHTGRYLGEAIYTSDKASNKAMSAAMKYACIMAFQIPTHGEPDDTEHYQNEVGHAKPAPEYSAPKAKNAPKEGPRLDTSNAALDISIALGDKISVADSFKVLFDLAQSADQQPEPGRGVCMEKVHARTRILIEGCADLINEIATSKNVPLQEPFTGSKLILEFVGQNFRGMMVSLQQRYGFSMTAAELDDYVRREEDVVIAKLQAKLREARVRQNAVATRLESAENKVRLREAYAGQRTEEAIDSFEMLEREADYAEGQPHAQLLAAPARTLEEENAELRVAERVEAELEAKKARRLEA